MLECNYIYIYVRLYSVNCEVRIDLMQNCCIDNVHYPL